MSGLLQFALIGLGAGAAYALLSLGLVLIKSGSGVVNFAHGSMAMVGAFLFFELHVSRSWPVLPALLVAVVLVAGLGLGVYWLVMRPLMRATILARIIATLGLLIALQGTCTLIWGDLPRTVEAFLPHELWRLGGAVVSTDRLLLLLIAVVSTAAVWAAVRFTPLGMAVRANAENRIAASTLGWSPNLLGSLTWGAGGSLAALAGILISPLTGIAVDQMPMLVIPALAATLVGRFTSFPITFGAAVAIGMLQSITSRYVDVRGVVEALPFLVILVVLVIMRPEIISRSQVAEMLPRLGSGRVRPVNVLVALAAGIGLMFVLPSELVYAVMISTTWAIVMLSVVVLLGYAGQLSLAQFALAGVAALVAGRVVSDFGAPFLVALVVGVAVTIPVGLIVALPALRTRGASLAVVTLGLGVTASAMIFNNEKWTGGLEGTPVGYPEIFGFPVDASLYPRRWAVVVLVLFALCALMVTNIRRGNAGRRLIAVRTNERAASALGVNVYGAKLYAFAVSAGVAAIGGILLGFRNPYVLYNDFVPFHSILVVGFVVVGGVGYVMGAFNGGALVTAGIGTWIMHSIVPGAQPVWLSVIGGVLVTAFVVLNADGLTDDQIHLGKRLAAKFRRHRPARAAAGVEARSAPSVVVPPATLTVEGATVRFGGVTALTDASVTIAPGRIVGLIGPNGAGKTTFIDAVTGFVRLAEGRVRLNGVDIGTWPVHRRARAGISRSFQSLELFESASVRDNLRVATDSAKASVWLTDLVKPGQVPLSDAALAAVDLLGLTEDLDTEVADLSYGRRRLVAIARAVAAAPSVLLLDEPAAGLSAEETAALGQAVRSLARDWGIAVLVIEHDMSFVMSVCDEITVLDFGHQIGGGTPEEVRRDPAVIAAYLGAGSDEDVPDAAIVDVESLLVGPGDVSATTGSAGGPTS